MRKSFLALLLVLAVFAFTPIFSVETKGESQAYVISNDIDWKLNMELLSKIRKEYGVRFWRITNLSSVRNAFILILGGHLAPTDEWMPKNYADELLSEDEKRRLESGQQSYLIKVIMRKDNRITIIAGFNRYNTSLGMRSSNDWDSLPNALEALIGTNPRKGDTDDDLLPDDQEFLKFKTDPTSSDTDLDGESDSAEILVYETDPKFAEQWNDFSTVVNILDAPKKISRYMKDHFKYYPDPWGEDIWQTPKETFDRKGGDCEDYAIFALYCLRKHGWTYDAFDRVKDRSAAVLGITWYGIEAGHAVLVYMKGGKYYLIHAGLIPSEGPFSDLESLINKVAQRLFFFSPEWESYFFINEEGQITEIIRRTD